MELQEKLQLLRKKNGYSQEQLADRIGISRQTIGKWENGQAIPELSGLIRLSELYGVTIDRIVKNNDECNIALGQRSGADASSSVAAAGDISAAIPFLIRAKKSCYAGKGSEAAASRMASHDFQYQEGDFYYHDTYLGGEKFGGEEAVWRKGKPIWCMNYAGRTLGENFSIDFLKEALSKVSADKPFRGPDIFTNGDYHYHSRVEGGFEWYQGYEEIFCREQKIYECFFHGGEVR